MFCISYSRVDQMRLGDISFWYNDIGSLPSKRAFMPGDASAEVCIIGAGYTGLWTAYYLKALAPDLDVAILESEFAGFGASGRNGGWLTGGFAWNHKTYLKNGSVQDVKNLVHHMGNTVDEILRVAAVEEIDADILLTDELLVATNPAQLARMHSEVAYRQKWGEAAPRVYSISAEEARARVNIPNVLGAMIVSNVARIQPAKLVQGLARVVENKGVRIYEATKVIDMSQGLVTTNRGQMRAPIILRATEGFTTKINGLKRNLLPLNSAQIVTEVLPQLIWDQIGWKGHEILGDFNNAYCYCQRTREGRLMVGGRGVPYRFGSDIDQNGMPNAETVRRLTAILYEHFPAARDFKIEHAWCGVLGVPRDWCASVGLDPVTKIGWAGGYVGVGVSTSNLAGRTLADLALGRDTELTCLPWVNHKVRKWEAEPLRYLGVHMMYRLLSLADRQEAKHKGPPSAFGRFANWLMGR
ncbi:MAG: FAD-binding oxidoreductase [Paracoccaceae bacterium]